MKELIETSVFAFKTHMKQKGRNYDFFCPFSRHKKYYKHFQNLVEYIKSLAGSRKLTKIEYLQIFLDYFSALSASYEARGIKSGFQSNQIDSVYSFEVFYEWVCNNWISMDRYLDICINKKKKQKEVKMEYALDFKAEMKTGRAGFDTITLLID